MFSNMKMSVDLFNIFKSCQESEGFTVKFLSEGKVKWWTFKILDYIFLKCKLHILIVSHLTAIKNPFLDISKQYKPKVNVLNQVCFYPVLSSFSSSLEGIGILR